MTKTAHTPGPLTMDGFGNIRAEGHPSLIAFGGVALGNRSDPEVKANDDRLFALWNALEGIANPDVVPEAIEAAKGLASDVQALIECRSDCGEYGAECPLQDAHKPDSTIDRLQRLLDAFAKLEGRS